ncbi:MAG: hypothetical protein R3D25_21120 [Geminicoccaceae bacterium]
MIAFNASLEQARVTEASISRWAARRRWNRMRGAGQQRRARANLARRIEGYDPAHAPAAHYCKGNYYTLKGRSPFDRLIYPVPETAGLSVHVTDVDMGGQCRFGRMSSGSKASSAMSTRDRPGLLCGRPQVLAGRWDGALETRLFRHPPEARPGRCAGSGFRRPGAAARSVSGLVHLFGIEPGAD